MCTGIILRNLGRELAGFNLPKDVKKQSGGIMSTLCLQASHSVRYGPKSQVRGRLKGVWKKDVPFRKLTYSLRGFTRYRCMVFKKE
jgi:hypothetical protein